MRVDVVIGSGMDHVARLTDTLFVVGGVDLKAWMTGTLEWAWKVVADLFAAVGWRALIVVCEIN